MPTVAELRALLSKCAASLPWAVDSDGQDAYTFNDPEDPGYHSLMAEIRNLDRAALIVAAVNVLGPLLDFAQAIETEHKTYSPQCSGCGVCYALAKLEAGTNVIGDEKGPGKNG